MAKQLLDLNEFAEALYRAGNPFAKDIIELIERNDVLEEFISDVEDVLIGFGAVPSKRFGHPTVKPAPVMDKIMRNINGTTICDPFMGTGSTGVAAIKAGKVFYGIENDPASFDMAVARIWEAYQGSLAL